MKWIDSKDFDAWASRRDCQEVLPLLIRRLIKATIRDLSLISFPAGDNIVYSGWDGRLISKEETEFIPIGLSLWEIGTNKDIRRKANDDYEKRKINHSEYNPLKTVFIFVTPRIWSKKEKWAQEKNKEGFWREVRVYDGRDLEECLENAPAVGAWLARHIGKYPHNVQALEDWYNEWSNVTNPQITPELVLGGRDKEREKIKDWLSSNPSSPLSVQAFTKDEAIAFLYGVISKLSDSEKDYFLSRCLIVNDKNSFKHIITTCKNGLLLIPNFEEIVTTLSYSKAHHIYIPLDPANTTSKDEFVLPFIKKEAFINALTKMGITEEDAEKYSRNTARILSVLRRQLSPVSLQPQWAKPDNVRQLLPALLVGRWNENKKGDKEIVSELAGLSYGDYIKDLTKWLYQPDPPIIQIGELWRLTSHLDLFFAISPFLTKGDFEIFKNSALKVLREINPALEIEDKRRWAASLYGKAPDYSKDLRKGIAETLILIAVFGDKVNSGKGLGLAISAQKWVDNLIYKLLNNANGKIWYSLSDVLPLIAEASPSSFLGCVENSLSQNPPPIMEMFSETDDIITSPTAHPSLIWALECLAWDPNLLGRVTLVLGKLAKLDPGGKLANRPINTLRSIFLLWLPQTFSTLKQRLECLDLLLKREPDIGWRVIIDLLPRPHDVGSFNYKPLWRVFSDKVEHKPTINEYLEGISKIVEMICDNIGNDGMKWFKVMENFSNLPPQHRKKIMNKLSECVSSIKEGRLELWNKLREILSRHRSFSDAEWALPEEELQELENLYNQLEPDDIIKRFLWLFDDYRPELPEGKELEDHEKFEQIVNQKRKDAMQSIVDKLKIDGVVKLAIQSRHPPLVGITLAEVCLTDKNEDTLFSLLDTNDNNKVSFVQAYIFKKSLTEGNRYIDKLINEVKNKNWSSKKIVNLFLGLPQKRIVWDSLKNFDTSIQQDYWKQLNPQFFELTKGDKVYGLEQLMRVKRYFTALDIAALFEKEIPPKFIAQLLLKAVTEKGFDSINIIHPWDIAQLFKIFDQSKEIERDEIARLEWLYLPILASPGSDRPPKALHQELADNPEFFTTLICYIYKSKSEELEEEEEQLSEELKKQRAHLAWELLHSWKTIPGSDDTGKIDYQKLKEWVNTVRNLCAESGRLEVCDSHIGQVFAWAVSEPDGNWPPEEICKIIEEIASEELDNGFIVGTHNKRGVFTKSLLEGGEQERMLAKQYRTYSEKLTIKYPKVSAILEKIAENYEIQAKHEDEQSKKVDLEW